MSARQSSASNSDTTYGWIERAFHWTTAGLIITAAVLGKLAYDASYETEELLSRKAFLFSWHKTVGVSVFFVALGRIGWALSQTRPRPLHADRKAETLLASVVHWLLYGSLVIVPLLGWSFHATTTGFAPIMWPFGQGLPLIPKDPDLGLMLSTLHKLSVRVLFIALALHILGTLKHVFVDKDLTFARMWRGAEPDRPLSRHKLSRALPLAIAAAIWGFTLIIGAARAPVMNATPQTAVSQTIVSETVTSDAENADRVYATDMAGDRWRVDGGTLRITVIQQGQSLSGEFGDWSAEILFNAEPDQAGEFGEIHAVIDIGSLRLGSSIANAVNPDFLAAAQFPQSVFTADIIASAQDNAYIASGQLDLRGRTVPVDLPFTLDINGDRAVANGAVDLDRRNFGIGETYPNETSIGFSVSLSIALTATRQ